MTRISPLRIAGTASAIVVLGLAGMSAVMAANPAPSSGTPTTGSGPSEDAAIDQLRDRVGGAARIRGLGRNVVHAVVTVDTKDGLRTFQVDHGTVDTVGSGTLTVAEQGGAKVTVSTNADTKVTRDRKKAALTDLKNGDQVWIVSRVEGSTATARRVFAPTKAAN